MTERLNWTGDIEIFFKILPNIIIIIKFSYVLDLKVLDHFTWNWSFWIVVLENALESPLDGKEIQAVNPKGNQSWIFIGRTDAEAETPTDVGVDGSNFGHLI